MYHRYDAAYLYSEGRLRSQASVIVDPDQGIIVAVGPTADLAQQYPECDVIVWPHHIIMPGTINSHAHAFQHLARGLGVDVPFLRWRDQTLYHLTPFLTPEALYVGSQLAFAEMLQSGITTVAEFFYIHGDNLDRDRAVIQAARDVGMRLVFARSFYDWDGAPKAYQESIDEAVSRTTRLAQELASDPYVSLQIAPHSLHGASDAMIQAAYQLSQELRVPCHIHVAEESFEVDEVKERTGRTPVAHLHHLGVLGASTIAVHLVCLTPDDVAIIGDTHTRWAYCPSSNLFLGDGIAPFKALRDAGVLAGLGTDGGCSNNRSSIFEEMRMAALLHKGVHQDATLVSYQDVLNMGTQDGATILGIPRGRLAPMADADFLGINLQHPSLAPWTEATLLPNLVYSMQPHAIEEVVVGGRPVVQGGQLSTIDQSVLIRRAHELVRRS